MKYKLLFSLVLVISLLAVFSFSVQSGFKPFRGFTISVEPNTLDARPGETVYLNGSVLNFGFWWLHDFNVTLNGLPQGTVYQVDPPYWQDLRILREWNEIQGLYFVPEKFSVTIDVPQDANGIYLVNVVGQEFQSFKQVSNSTEFILRVSGTPPITVSDIVVPERVVQNEPFTLTMSVRNDGRSDQLVNISVEVPATWLVDPKEASTIVGAGNVTPLSFSVTPSTEVGTISVLVEYPVRETVLNITKVGSQIIPQSPFPLITPGVTGQFADVLQFLNDNPIVAVIIVVIIILVIMYVSQTYDFYKRRRKPEEMKRQIEPVPDNPQV